MMRFGSYWDEKESATDGERRQSDEVESYLKMRLKVAWKVESGKEVESYVKRRLKVV